VDIRLFPKDIRLTGHIAMTTIVITKKPFRRYHMQRASVSELKASASEYLLRVKAGEEVLITDRGKPVAKIIPLRRSELDADARIAQLERAGLAKVGTGKLPADFWLIPRPRDKEGAVVAALIAEREEGR
jgi:prevent-host-death family protein